MKQTKKVIAMLLAMAMVLALGTTAFAQDVVVGTGVGSVTISNATVGETYKLYKLFDASYGSGGAVVYKTTKEIKSSSPGATWFTTKQISTGVWSVEAKPTFDETVLKPADPTAPITDPANAKYKAFMDWAISYAGNPVSEAQAESVKLKFDQVPYGYYLIKSTHNDGAIISVDTAKPNANVVDKNTTLQLDEGKVIVLNKGLQNEERVKVNTAEINKDKPLDFDLGMKPTNYIAGEKVYEVYVIDTIPEGMTFKAGTLNAKVGGFTVLEGTGEKKYSITYYTDTALTKPIAGPIDQDKLNTARAFKMTFQWTADGTTTGTSSYGQDKALHVTYQAYLDSDKFTKNFTDGRANINEMKWGAKSGPGIDTEGPTSTTETYNTNLEVFKFRYDENQQQQLLRGAEFTLTRMDGTNPIGTLLYITGTRYIEDTTGTYWLLKDGTYTTTDPTAAGVNAAMYADVNTKYRYKTFTEVVNTNTAGSEASAYVNSKGIVNFAGLYEGTYRLSETVVPQGYNQMPDKTFTVKFDKNTKKFTCDEDFVSIVEDGATGKCTLKIEAENKSGTTLPTTGGMGTTVFYALGSLLVIGAGVMLFARKRMGQQEN